MGKYIRFYFYVLVFGALFIAYAYAETYWIKTNYVQISSKQIPGAFVGKRIVFVSDIHHGPYFSIKRVNNLVRRINQLQPDIILLGGDYVHRNPIYIEPVFKALNKLKANNGVFAIYGNHDHWEGFETTGLMMKRNGFRDCDNQSYWIRIANDSLKIGGVGDFWKSDQLLDSTTYDVRNEDFCILLSHNPDYFEDLDTAKIDLALAGHTHGGQITFFGLWAPVLPTLSGNKFRHGLKNMGPTQVYTTSGIGTITPPLRFFCRPEIVCFELSNE